MILLYCENLMVEGYGWTSTDWSGKIKFIKENRGSSVIAKKENDNHERYEERRF